MPRLRQLWRTPFSPVLTDEDILDGRVLPDPPITVGDVVQAFLLVILLFAIGLYVFPL